MLRPPRASTLTEPSANTQPGALWADVLLARTSAIVPGARLALTSDWHPDLRYLVLDVAEDETLDASRLWASLPTAVLVEAEAIQEKRGGVSLLANKVTPLLHALADVPTIQTLTRTHAENLRLLSNVAILPFAQAAMDTRCFRFSTQHLASLRASQTCITCHESWNGAYSALFAWRRHGAVMNLELAVVTDIAEATKHAVFRPLAVEMFAPETRASDNRVRTPSTAHLKLVRT